MTSINDNGDKPTEDAGEQSKDDPKEKAARKPRAVKVALDNSTVETFRKLTEGLKVPVPASVKLSEVLKRDSVFHKLFQEEQKRQELFKGMAGFQKAMKDAASESDRYRDIFKSIDASTSASKIATQGWDALLRDMPNVAGLLKGSTSLNLDARARATSSAERYLEILPPYTEGDLEAVLVDKGFAAIEEPSEPRCLDTMRMDMVALVTQTEGRHTELLTVIVANEKVPLVDSGFMLGGLSDFEGRKTIDCVVAERKNEAAEKQSRKDKFTGATFALVVALIILFIKSVFFGS